MQKNLNNLLNIHSPIQGKSLYRELKEFLTTNNFTPLVPAKYVKPNNDHR